MGLAIREVASVFKLRIGVAIAFSALAGLAVTPGPAPAAWKIAVLVLAVLVSAASAGAYNQYAERDLDARMDRTRGRPFVSGAFRADGRWLAAIAILLAIVMFLWTPPHFWSLATALRADYEAAGVPMLPVVMGDAVAARVILAHTVALVALSLVPAAFGLGWLYLGAAALGGAWFLWKSIALLRAPGPKAAMANFHASLGQLGLLLAGAVADGWLHV